MNDNDLWMAKYSDKLLREVGIKTDQVVLDFGCRIGNYSIPSAKIVGENGCVYALDSNKDSLCELMKISEQYGLKNIESIEISEEPKIPLPDGSVDVVLLFDVIHLINDRERLYKEVFRVAREHALVSVLPKHFREYMKMSLEDVKCEIDKIFGFQETFFRLINHDDKLQKGHIFNFRKI